METKRKNIAILGSTGSIGTQALDIIRDYPDKFSAEVLVANNNAQLLIAQAREFEPNFVVIANKDKYPEVRDALADLPIKVYAGSEAILDVVAMDCVDMVLAAMEISEERLNSADFSDPYYTDYPPMVLVKASAAEQYNSLESFSGKSVGAQTATTKEGIVKDDMPGATLVSLQNVNDLVNQLVNDKIDAVVLDGAVALQFVSTNADLAVASVDLGEAYPYCVAVAKGDPKGLLPGINAAIADMLANNKVEEFVEAAGSFEDVWQEVSAEG